MPVATGPSQGFLSRLRQNMPQMVNALGQQYGGNLSGAAKVTSGMMDRNRRPGMGNQQQDMGGRTTQAPGMPPMVPDGGMSGMVRGPSMPRVSPGGFGMPPVGGIGAPSMPPGMMGGPNMPPPMGTPGLGMGMAGGGGLPPAANSGLWDAYNSLSNQTGGPNRRMLLG